MFIYVLEVLQMQTVRIEKLETFISFIFKLMAAVLDRINQYLFIIYCELTKLISEQERQRCHRRTEPNLFSMICVNIT